MSLYIIHLRTTINIIQERHKIQIKYKIELTRSRRWLTFG